MASGIPADLIASLEDLKHHFVYLAIGLKVPSLLPTFYIGVRSGSPADCYKTSSQARVKGKWAFVCKIPLSFHPNRAEANRAEAEILRWFKRENYWNLLENRCITSTELVTQGVRPWNKGIPHSKETKEKIRKKARGRRVKKKPGAHDGERNPMWGKIHSEETKQKIAKKAKGRKVSDETKNKISNALKASKTTRSKKQRKAMWSNHFEIWSTALEKYSLWLYMDKPGYHIFSKKYGKGFKNMCEKFRKGWNPYRCETYLEWQVQYLKT